MRERKKGRGNFKIPQVKREQQKQGVLEHMTTHPPSHTKPSYPFKKMYFVTLSEYCVFKLEIL